MNVHPDPFRLWSDRRDGALDEDPRREFEAHLAACPECRARVEAEERLERAFEKRLRAPLPMPAPAWDRLAARLDPPPVARGPFRPAARIFPWIASAAAAALLAALLVPDLFVSAPRRVSIEVSAENLHLASLRGRPEVSSERVEEVRDFLRRRAGEDCGLPYGPAGGHDLKVAGVGVEEIAVFAGEPARRVRAARLDYACCGERITIIVFSRSSLGEFPALEAALAGGSWSGQTPGGYRAAAEAIGGRVVYAVGRHPLEGVLEGFRKANARS